MIDADDLAQMQADMSTVVADAGTAIVIRRGEVSLASQTVRIARRGSGSSAVGGLASGEARGLVVVVGGVDFDVQAGDRFNDANGTLYRVVIVRPNRRVMVVAEAELVE